MSVLVSSVKDKKELVASCSCGCNESIHIRIDDEDPDLYMILSYMGGSFYTEQRNSWDLFRRKLKKIVSIIRNKDYYYAEICMNREEFQTFKDYINSIQ